MHGMVEERQLTGAKACPEKAPSHVEHLASLAADILDAAVCFLLDALVLLVSNMRKKVEAIISMEIACTQYSRMYL